MSRESVVKMLLGGIQGQNNNIKSELEILAVVADLFALDRNIEILGTNMTIKDYLLLINIKALHSLIHTQTRWSISL